MKSRLDTYTLSYRAGFAFLHDYKGQLLISANYVHDLSDGATLLSNFVIQNNADQHTSGLPKILADKIRSALQTRSVNCKLIIWPDKFAADFADSPDFNSETDKSVIERLMLRDKGVHSADEAVSDNVSLLTDENISDNDVTQLLDLLRQHTYWGTACTMNYISQALQSSKVFVMREDNKVVGFVRYITNGQAGYISDIPPPSSRYNIVKSMHSTHGCPL